MLLLGVLLSDLVFFGPGDPGFSGMVEMASAIAALRAMNPVGKAPLLCSEFYSGWATHWGQAAPTATSTAWLVGNLSSWLHYTRGVASGDQRLSASVNLYIFLYHSDTPKYCRRLL